MSEMTKRERVRATLAGEPADRVPTSLWRHDFLREWGPRELVDATLDAYRADDWDFIKFNPRATYFAEAWGNTYERPATQRQPRLFSASLREVGDLARLQGVDAKAGVFAEHLEALRLLLSEAGDVDVVQTVFSPLSVVAMLCGADAIFREWALADPMAAEVALSAVAGTLADYARGCIDAGAVGIFYAPLSWASRDTCDDAFYTRFGRPYDLRILDAVQDAEFNILHVCRNHNMLDALLDYPVAAFNWADHGDGNPALKDVRQRTSTALMGGIDQAHLHTMKPEEVSGQATEALRVKPGLFLTGGCAIRPDTPATNRAAVAASVRGQM